MSSRRMHSQCYCSVKPLYSCSFILRMIAVKMKPLVTRGPTSPRSPRKGGCRIAFSLHNFMFLAIGCIVSAAAWCAGFPLACPRSLACHSMRAACCIASVEH